MWIGHPAARSFTPVKRNRGAIALQRTGKGLAAIAADLEVSAQTVHRWAQAEKKPAAGARRERLRELYGIEPAWWDEEAGRPKTAGVALPPPPPPARDDALVAGGAFAMARALEDMARRQIEALADDGVAEGGTPTTPLERARVMASIATTIDRLARITGDYDLGRRLTKLPMWKRLEAELAAVLRPYPDAAKAVAERFAALDAEASAAG